MFCAYRLFEGRMEVENIVVSESVEQERVSGSRIDTGMQRVLRGMEYYLLLVDDMMGEDIDRMSVSRYYLYKFKGGRHR